MRPKRTTATIAIVCALWGLLLSVGTQANPVNAATRERVIALTEGVSERFYDRLDPNEGGYVEDQLARLSPDASDALMSAREISSVAVMIAATASSAYMPVILTSAAARVAPDDPLIVNNFAAMLRSSGLLDESIEVLLYADSLAPNSPVILTNLGHSYLDQGMLGEAEIAYSRALASDADFDAAHYGMSIIWVRRGHGDLAMRELSKAARGGFLPSMRQVYLGAKMRGGSASGPFWDVIIDEEPSDPQSDGLGDQGDDAPPGPQGDRLILPTLPEWESRAALLASAPALQNLARQIMDKGLIGALAFATRYHPEALGDAMSGDGDWDDSDWDDSDWDDSDCDGRDWDGSDWDGSDWDGSDWDGSGSDSEPGSSLQQIISAKPQYGQQLFMLELVNDYYTHMIEQELARVSARRQQIDERYQREMTDLKEGGQLKQLEQMIVANQIPEAKELAKTVNKLAGQIADSHFYAWRDLTLDCHERLKPLLLEYWKMSDQVTASIYDQEIVDYVNAAREITIYASFLPLALDLTTLPVAYTMADYIAPIVSQDEDLGALRAQAVGELVVPEKKPKECELKNKLSFSVGIASFAVDCSSWELELLAGAGGAYKRNFKTGESEISVLVGAKVGAGAGPVGGELSAKGGVTLRFDRDGNFVGWSDRGELGMKTGVGPLSASQSLEGSASLGTIAGPRTQTTSNFGFGD